MTIAGPLGNLMFFFQGYQIFASRSAGAVSLPGFAISLVALCSWLSYGIYIKNKPLIAANAVGVIGALIVIAGIVSYRIES